MLTDLSKICRR